MARLSRYFIKNQPQHVIQRGNNRTLIFADARDYSFYKECLLEACRRYDLVIHAYVLMTNHVHLLVSPKFETSKPKVLQSVGRKYVQYFNYTYNRTGTLWEGRYKATIIDSSAYLLICMRYIELNPVRANMVKMPDEYPYSSYVANALGQTDNLVSPHGLYKALGKDSRNRQNSYQDLFKIIIGETNLNNIRSSTNKGWALGCDSFREKVEILASRRSMPKKRGRPKKKNN